MTDQQQHNVSNTTITKKKWYHHFASMRGWKVLVVAALALFVGWGTHKSSRQILSSARRNHDINLISRYDALVRDEQLLASAHAANDGVLFGLESWQVERSPRTRAVLADWLSRLADCQARLGYHQHQVDLFEMAFDLYDDGSVSFLGDGDRESIHMAFRAANYASALSAHGHASDKSKARAMLGKHIAAMDRILERDADHESAPNRWDESIATGALAALLLAQANTTDGDARLAARSRADLLLANVIPGTTHHTIPGAARQQIETAASRGD